MIGNETDAALALSDYETARYDFLFNDEGGSRDVFLINNVIYKVNKGYANRWSNEDEWTNYNAIDKSTLPAHISIPEMSRFDIGDQIIIAAEKVTGIMVGECFDRLFDFECATPENCIPVEIEKELRRFTEDICLGNIVYSDGVYHIIDLG